jgi:uncharacterized damage-inducible protein DinB
MSKAIMRPESGEYAEYYSRYVSLVPEGDVVATLERQLDDVLALLRSIPEEKETYRYEEGKWSIRELVGHVADTERIFAYRALRFSRGDRTPIEGFEQDDYVPTSGHADRSLASLVDEFEYIRRSTIALLAPLSDEAWARRGVASDNEVSVRALAYIIAGHVAHHIGILRSRYLDA